MNSNENSFHNLTKLIEDTQRLLNKQLQQTRTLDELTIITDQYFKLYEYRSDIVKGITSTLDFRELLEDKYEWLKSLSEHCDIIYKSIDIPELIDSDENYLFFAKSSIIRNRVKPILDFVIHEIEVCLQTGRTNTEISEENILDLSDSNAVQKILYLNELGIIKFLRTKQPFSTSPNSLATILSAITKENTTTLQPYLNALLNKTAAENKHPYYTPSTVDKVKKHLISIGFKAD